MKTARSTVAGSSQLEAATGLFSFPTGHHRLSRGLRLRLLAATALLCLSPVATAVTPVAGTISSNTTWATGGDNIYEVTGDLTVAAGVSLTIQPGVTVRFRQYRGLWVQGTLNASGTEVAPIVFTGTSATKGWWWGIHIQGAGSASFNRCEIGYAGYYDSLSLRKEGSGNLILQDTTVRDGLGNGIHITNSTGQNLLTNVTSFNHSASGMYLNNSAASATGCTFRDNASYGLLHGINDTLIYPDNTFSGNAAGSVGVNAGTVSKDLTWTRDIDLTLLGDSSVAEGKTLTIQPGVTVRFARYAGLWVDGTLHAAGNAGSAINFTGTSATKGWWRGVQIRNAGSATLDYCDFSFAGYYDNLTLGKSGSGGLSLSRSILRDSSDRGLVVDPGYSSFVSANNQFNNNVTGCDIRINASFDDNTSDFSGNTGADVYLNGGTINQNAIWSLKPTYSLYVSGDITVAAGATLTIKPATVVKFDQYDGLYVLGNLVAEGTQASPIHFTDWRDDTVGGDANKNAGTNTPSAGWWSHIHFNGSGAGSFNWCTFSYAGYYNYVTLWKEGDGDLSVSNSIVRNGQGDGITVSGSSGQNLFTNVTTTGNSAAGMYLINSPATVTGCSFTGNGSYGLRQTSNDSIIYSDNTFSGNAVGGVGINGGTIGSDITWTQGIDAVVAGDLTVAAGATLTIQPGATVRFNRYCGIWVDGTLNAAGSPGAKVNFTGSSPTKGWWRGIIIQNAGSAALDHCDLSYAGYYDNLTVSKTGSGSLSLTNSIVRESSSRGLVVSAGYSSFVSAGNQFDNNGTGCQIGINASFDDNTSDFSGNTGADVYLNGGTISQDTVWNLKPAYSFHVSGDLTVAAGVTLTVKPGTVVKFAQYQALWVQGILRAEGTSGAPIHFTDWRDDTVGGDANKNGDANAAAPGWWRRIDIQNPGSASLNWCEIAYGGYYDSIGLSKSGGGELSMRHSTVRHSSGYGFHLANSSGTNTLHQNIFRNNGSSGMYLANSAVSATNCTFRNNGAYGLLHEINDTLVYPDNTFFGNTAGSVGINGGTLGKNLTWTRNIDLVLRGDSSIAEGRTLTIEQGVTVRFAQYVGLWVDGTLNAVGTDLSPVVFTGTNTNKGWWRGVQVRNAGSAGFQSCEIAYAGYYDSVNVLKSGSGSLFITDSYSHDCAGDALRISAGSAAFVSARNRFENSNFGCRIGVGASFDDMTSDFAGNNIDVHLDGGTTAHSPVWGLKPDYSLYLSGDYSVPAATTLTVRPGTVVKFAQYKVLSVAGHLDARGAPSAMIHFTDWRDDSVGGDANHNGSANSPAAGWWGWLHLHATGSAAMDWCRLAYAGYYYQVGLWKESSGDLALQNSIITDTRGDGLQIKGSSGNHLITRDTFIDNWNGVSVAASQTAPVTISGCTIEGNTSQGSGSFGIRNASTSITVDARGNWWGSDTGPQHSSNPTGTGDRVSDRVLFDPWRRSEATASILSPMRSGTLVAGDSLRFSGSAAQAGAGYAWNFGSGRTSNQRSPGVISFPDAGTRQVTFTQVIDGQADPFPDRRSFTVVADNGAFPDLRAREMTVPANLPVGQATPIHYEAGNAGEGPVTGGTWKDAVYLSDDALLDVRDIEVGSTTVERTLAVGEIYQGSISVRLPAVDEGSRFLILSVNDTWQVVERRRLNNELANSASVLIPALTAGGVTSGTLDPRGLGEGHHFRFDLAAPGNLRLRLTGNATVYVRTGGLAGPRNFMWQGNSSGDLLLSGLPAGPLFIHVANNLSGTPTKYTLLAERADLLVSKVDPPQAAAGADLTLTVEGLGFVPGLDLALIRGATRVSAKAGSLQVFSSRRLTAVFPGASLTTGTYALEASGTGLAAVQLANAVSISPAAKPHLTLNLVVPDRLGYHGLGTLFVEYGNDGNAPMPAPLILLTPTQNGGKGAILTLDPNLVTQGFWTSALAAGFQTSIQLLGSGRVAGTLMPGEQRRVPVYYAGWLQPWDFRYPAFNFRLSALTADDTRPVPWAAGDSLIQNMRPAGMSDNAWNAVRSALSPGWGSTIGQFVARLGQNAAYLENIGERTDDVDRLVEFEVSKARGVFHPLAALASKTDLEIFVPGELPLLFARYYPHELGARFATGALGQGWTHVWDYRLQVRSDGMLTLLQPGGSMRLFAPDVRGGYLAMPDDHGRMRAVSGGYLLTEKDGNKARFDSTGRLVELRDRLNHTITLAYAGGLLSGLQHSNGASLAMTYQNGRITAVTDHYGRQVGFTYDSQGRMSGSTDVDGRQTAYTYGAALGSLSSISEPNGALRQFAYNSRHAVTQASLVAGGTTHTAVNYISDGARMTVSDGLGRQFTLAYDQHGLVRSASDPYGRQSYFAFDHALRNTSALDAQGFGLRFAYDSRGNLTRAAESTGASTAFTYGTNDRLASRTDGTGLRYQYSHDASGNLVKMQGPDGSSWQWTYGANGRPASFTDRSGARQVYGWNNAGQLTSMADGDGTVLGQYDYDASNRITRLTSPTDSMELTYAAGDRIGEVRSADGSRVSFGYDSFGRRTFMANQAGHRVNYHYDSAGRLQRLSDAAGETIVQYAYDGAGNLSRKTLGNGVYTEYETDAYGKIRRQTTCRSDGSELASVELTYDASGRLQSHLSGDGEWQMAYDPAGRLIERSFTPVGAGSPDRAETFSYDAAGELIRRTYNGVSHDITRNSWGLVTSDGERTYDYDADGRVISRTGAGGLVTYSSDADGRVTSMRGAEGITSVTYDAMGNLKSSSRPGGEALMWQIDPAGTGPLAVLDGGGNVVEGYYQGLGMAARDTTSGRLFPEHDPVSGRVLFEIDAAGNLVAGGSPPVPPVGFIPTSNEERMVPAAAPGMVTGIPFGGFGMQPLFPYGANELGLVIQAGQAIANSPHVSQAQGAAADLLRNQTFGNVTGVLGIVTSSDVMYPTYQVVMRGGSILHSGLNKLNVVVTDIPDFNSMVGKIGQHSAKFDKFGQVLGVVGLAAGGVEIYDGLTSSKDNFELAEKVLHGGGNVLLAGAGLLAAGTVAAPMVAAVGVGVFIVDNLGVGKWVSNKLYPWTSGPMERFWNWWDGLDPDAGNYVGQSVGSMDPNELTGPSGYGAANWRAPVGAYGYKIDFENDADASAPAQIVTITNNLPANLNRSTFSLTAFGFGDVVVPFPANDGNFLTTVDLLQDGRELEVEVDASFDPAIGRLVVRFTTLDKQTGLPPEVDYGFLPAEDGSGRGKGFVSYVVNPKAGLATGTQIRNIAVINFDFAYDIATNQVDPHDPSKGTDPAKEALVTVDSSAPASWVAALPAAVKPEFQVRWSGNDGTGSGIASYTIRVSEDLGKTWKVWLTDTRLTTATYKGVAGRRYRFHSVAMDNVGNMQTFNPATATAATLVVGSPMIAVQQPGGTIIPAGTGRIDLGKVKTGFKVTRTFTIRNRGPVPLNRLAVAVSGSHAAYFKAGKPLVATLAPGKSATFTLTYSPLKTGIHAALLNVASDDPHIPSYRIALAGTGLPTPKIALILAGKALTDGRSIAALGNATVGGKAVIKTFTITNTGKAKLTRLAVKVGGTNRVDFTASPLKATSLAPGRSMQFTVTFRPKAAGVRAAALQVLSNDPKTASFDVKLTGRGLAPAKRSPAAAALMKALLGAETDDGKVKPVASTVRIDGQTYRCLTLPKSSDVRPAVMRVEVSPNLVDWFRGGRHTTVVREDADSVTVRDNTPLESGSKRFIRDVDGSDAN